MGFIKITLALLFLSPLSSMGDNCVGLSCYKHPLILKPYIIRDGSIITSDKSHWIKLPWKNFVAIGQDKLLFRYEGTIVTCPMEGYICLQEDK